MQIVYGILICSIQCIMYVINVYYHIIQYVQVVSQVLGSILVYHVGSIQYIMYVVYCIICRQYIVCHVGSIQYVMQVVYYLYILTRLVYSIFCSQYQHIMQTVCSTLSRQQAWNEPIRNRDDPSISSTIPVQAFTGITSNNTSGHLLLVTSTSCS